MTVQEVSAYLHVHPSMIYRMLKHDQIPAFHMGSDGQWPLRKGPKTNSHLSLRWSAMRRNFSTNDVEAPRRMAWAVIRPNQRSTRLSHALVGVNCSWKRCRVYQSAGRLTRPD
jgi:excisionase family DNA binding protein